MSNLAKRLDVHFAAVAAVGAVAGIGATAPKAEGAVVYSGVLNTPITANIDGIYLNLVTGQTGTSGSGVSGWDINPYVTGGSWTSFSGAATTGWFSTGTQVAAVTAGTLIDAAGTYAATNQAYSSGFSNTAIMAIKFRRESDSATLYGWVRLTLPGAGGTSATAGTLVDYAYEDSGAGINAPVPAPTAGMGALALGAAGLLGRRRK